MYELCHCRKWYCKNSNRTLICRTYRLGIAENNSLLRHFLSHYKRIDLWKPLKKNPPQAKGAQFHNRASNSCACCFMLLQLAYLNSDLKCITNLDEEAMSEWKKNFKGLSWLLPVTGASLFEFWPRECHKFIRGSDKQLKRRLSVLPSTLENLQLNNAIWKYTLVCKIVSNGKTHIF